MCSFIVFREKPDNAYVMNIKLFIKRCFECFFKFRKAVTRYESILDTKNRLTKIFVDITTEKKPGKSPKSNEKKDNNKTRIKVTILSNKRFSEKKFGQIVENNRSDKCCEKSDKSPYTISDGVKKVSPQNKSNVRDIDKKEEYDLILKYPNLE